MLPLARSRRKLSWVPLVSSTTRLVAKLWKATKRPSAEIETASPLSRSPSAPPEERLTHSVVRVRRSCTNASWPSFVSAGTRLSAALVKTTKRPPAERATPTLAELACAPLESTLTRSIPAEACGRAR